MPYALLLAAVIAQQPAPAEGSAVQNMVKDALTQPEASDGPDVTKMPFTPDSIRKVVAFHQPKIQACYEEHLASKGNKKVEGVLKTHWLITAEGYVEKAAVLRKGSTLKDPKLHDCVTAVLASMNFPKPPDGKPQPIDFPFNLKAVP